GDGLQGNSVPRFHITMGTGPGVLAPFLRRLIEHEAAGWIAVRPRHRVDALTVAAGAVTGVAGTLLAESHEARGVASSREPEGPSGMAADAVVITAGGIGGNFALVRECWPQRLGTPPARMLAGVPAHVDGRMLAIAEAAGGRVVNRDRMWHYVEGIANHSPI